MLVGAPFLALALGAVMLTLWVSWQLDGGAAAVNEAGRLRMQAYRMAMTASLGDSATFEREAAEFERSLALLRDGDPSARCSCPGTTSSPRASPRCRRTGRASARWRAAGNASLAGLPADRRPSRPVDAFVTGIEAHMSRWTALLHLSQFGMLMLAIGHGRAGVRRFPLRSRAGGPAQGRRAAPPARATRGARRRSSSDEFGTLADGFNSMAEHLRSMYRNLEAQGSAKTARCFEESAASACRRYQ